MDITCAIPTIGRTETLPAVLNSIAFQTRRISELVLLDEALDPVTENYAVSQALDYLSLIGVRVVVLRERNRKGIGPARYRLCEEAKHDLVLQVDDDVVLAPKCVEYLLPYVEGAYSWAVPSCFLVSATISSEGYLSELVSSDDERVVSLIARYPWFAPYFRYTDDHVLRLSMAGTQAILLDKKEVIRKCSGLLQLGRLPREDIYLTSKLGCGMFISRASCLHYEHPSQKERGSWDREVFYRLHYAVNEMPENYASFMGGNLGDV